MNAWSSQYAVGDHRSLHAARKRIDHTEIRIELSNRKEVSLVMSSRLALSALLVATNALVAQIPSERLTRPLLPEWVRHSQMYSYVDANIPEVPRFPSVEEWRLFKSQLKPRLPSLIGIDDILEKYSLKVISRRCALCTSRSRMPSARGAVNCVF
jgi:hypothetical protein